MRPALGIVPLALVLPLLGCPFYGSRPPLELPQVPKPLVALNTSFNDYNAAAPDTAHGLLVFSSDRGSQGRQYDLWRADLGFEEDQVTANAIGPFEPGAMSDQNELGPHFTQDGMLVFASDRPGGAGGLDLYRWPVRSGGAPAPGAPEPLVGLNTAGYEGYWAKSPDGDEAYFASDRAGQGLDVFRVTPALGGPDARIERVDALSTRRRSTCSAASSPRSCMCCSPAIAPAGRATTTSTALGAPTRAGRRRWRWVMRARPARTSVPS